MQSGAVKQNAAGRFAVQCSSHKENEAKDARSCSHASPVNTLEGWLVQE